MTIKEVFPNPTVKEVAFEIRFPNLFFIESKIGDLQLQIMKEFPNSSLVFQRHLVFADIGPEVKIEEMSKDLNQESCKKIWQFKSDKNFYLNVSSDSLNIASKYHKTYNLGVGDKFRDIIKFVLDSFLKVTSIPLINRIGIRYIDECPILAKDNKTFSSYYNTTFPLERFSVDNASGMEFKVLVEKKNNYLRYIESLRKLKDKDDYVLVLDFDGYAKNIKSEDYLTVADSLHDLISEEFEKTIKQPLIDYMRKPKEGKNGQ